MPTKLYQHIYDGGEGTHDKSIFIGYCKEKPQEVLLKLIKEYRIQSYKTMYCDPLGDSPSDGLELYRISEEDCNKYGINIFKSIEDYLNLIEEYKQYEWNKFSIEKFDKKINKLEKYYKHFDGDNFWKDVYKGIWQDFKYVKDMILKEE